MFSKRRSEQKPNQQLIHSFRKQFGDIVPRTSSSDAGSMEPIQNDPNRPDMTNADMGFGEMTPRAAMQDLRFTPFLDPNALAYLPSGNQPNGYYTPNSGNLGSALHDQSADMRQSNIGLNMMTPLALPSSAVGAPMGPDAPAFDYNNIGHHYYPQQYHVPSPQYAPSPRYAPSPFMQQSFAPGAFMNNPQYDSIGHQIGQPGGNNMGNAPSQLDSLPTGMGHAGLAGSEQEEFRYITTLRAPTAMIRHPKEIPVTYLNKGQAYSISVVDTNPRKVPTEPVKYRTCIRVTFEEEEQRSKPSACWQLWKEGRGLSEANQRDGKLQAVEYVDPIQGDEEHKKRQIELESSSFDGFSVIWTANQEPDTAINVRFNFLSTDFSHSKGVKGIPLRLCAKTEIVSPEHKDKISGNPELCYCKVKLFRDHGAERKLANDAAHVRKEIEKLSQQISHVANGVGGGVIGFGKRKRSLGSMALKESDDQPSKLSKPIRRWSHEAQNDHSTKESLEDDLQMKLAMKNEVLKSTRQVSVLNLRGDEQDDPDNPVQLFSEPKEILKDTTGEFQPNVDPMLASATLSPRSSIMSMVSARHPLHERMSYDSGYNGSLESSREHSRPSSEGGLDKHPINNNNSPIKVSKMDIDRASQSDDCVDAVEVDSAYKPPAEQRPRVLVLYIHFPHGKYYHATYLHERTVQDLKEKIAEKLQVDPSRIVRMLQITRQGLEVLLEDDTVRYVVQGLNMIANVNEIPTPENPTALEVTLTFNFV